MASRAFQPTPLHRAWRLLPVRHRHRLIRSVGAALAPRAGAPPERSIGIAILGEFSRASGLGEGARLMLKALQHLGVPCHAMDVGPLLPGHRADLPSPSCAMPPDGYALIIHVNPPLLPLVLLRLQRGLLHGRRLIGYWAWELPVVPHHWQTGARFVHEAWAPSRFTAAALEPILPGRVRVVPHPVGVDRPHPVRARSHFGIPDSAVAILVSANLASSFERKNPLAAVRAFQQAFGDRQDRLLILKTGNPDHFPVQSASLFKAVSGASNVVVLTHPLSPEAAASLTASADILLSLHRSEGFGLVIAEAMLQGKPVIATGWSGNMDFMDATNAIPVPYRLVPVVDPRGVYDVPGTVWAEPDITAAAQALRQLADDARMREQMGERARAVAGRLDAHQLAEAVRGLGIAV